MAQEYSDISKISNIDVQTVVEVLKARSTSNFLNGGSFRHVGMEPCIWFPRRTGNLTATALHVISPPKTPHVTSKFRGTGIAISGGISRENRSSLVFPVFIGLLVVKSFDRPGPRCKAPQRHTNRIIGLCVHCAPTSMA